MPGGDPLEPLRAGANMFLEAHGARRPSGSSCSTRRQSSAGRCGARSASATAWGLVIWATLEAAMEAGAITRRPVRPLAHILLGALDEAAMLVARAEDPEAARAEVGRTIDTLLGALKR